VLINKKKVACAARTVEIIANVKIRVLRYRPRINIILRSQYFSNIFLTVTGEMILKLTSIFKTKTLCFVVRLKILTEQNTYRAYRLRAKLEIGHCAHFGRFWWSKREKLTLFGRCARQSRRIISFDILY